MVYLVTLIVIIFYTNYTFQIAKFTAKGPALLAVQIQHSNVLRDFLKIWRSSVENKRSMEHAITKKELARNNQRNLDAYWEYRDFVDYHLPSDYHTLVTDWQRFEKINSDLDKLSYNLYSRLESDLNDKVIGISKEINIKPVTTHFDNFVSRIYETCCMYFNSSEREELESELTMYGSDEYRLSFNGMEAFFSGDKAQIEYAKKELDNFLSKNNLLKNYKDYMEQIKNKLDEHEELRKVIEQNLNELIKWPIFPGTKCKRVKDFDIME
jgi:hypothetical protein